MATFIEKFRISAQSAGIFALVSLPLTYRITNRILPINTFNLADNCPTHVGSLIHTLVFFVTTYLSMLGSDLRAGIKLKNSLYATLIAYFLSSSAVYSLIGAIFGPTFADISGCPSILGIFFSAVIYFMALIGVMYLPN